MERLKQQLQAEGIAYRADEPLAAHCTFKIGGPADVFALPETEEQLCRVIALCKEQGVKYYLLGNGSNILFEDAGYRGAVINVSAMKSAIGILENICFPGKDPALTYDAVVVGADKMLSSLCITALENSLTGLEFAYGIPGTVGGAVYMNAGAYGGEMKDVVTSCRYVGGDGEIHEMSAAEMQLTYRHSVFSGSSMVITSVTMELVPGDKAEIKSRMEELMQRRRDKQPLNFPSCGSTFKRPDGYFAAALIEECGLKGFTIGGAQVSEKHSGFVINRGHATFEDVMAVVNEVKRVVLEKKGVELECEMLILQ